MSFENERLSQGFDQVFAEPAPPTTVNVGQLLADGHRLLIRRRARAALAGTAALALAAVLVPGLLPGSTSAQVGAAASPSAKNDPLTLSVSFTWLPSGVVPSEYVHSAGGISGHSEALMANSDDGTIQLDLTTVPAPWGTPPSAKGALAGVVNGHQAYWKPKPKPVGGGVVGGGESLAASFDELVFQSGSGQWALLQSIGVSAADQLRIARGIAFGPTATALPLQLTGVPVASTAMGASLVDSSNGLITADVNFTVGGTKVSITAAPAHSGSSSSTSGGSNDGSRTASETSNGLAIRVVLTGPASAGDAAAYLHDITSLGTDRADWTTSVVLP